MTSFISSIQTQEKGEADTTPTPSGPAVIDSAMAEDVVEGEFPPLYVSGEDVDQAMMCKHEASNLVHEGNFEEALAMYTAAILAAPPSSLLYARRASALLTLGRPRAAERDCDEALKENPDCALALRIRGKARKELGQWESALHDLADSQQIDFDEDAAKDLKYLSEKHVEQEMKDAAERVH
jgi:suppressor of tumorigenicity protein 13